MIIRILVPFALSLGLYSGTALAADLYWVSLINADGAAIMQIDVHGNVIQPPKMIVGESNFEGFLPATALSENDDGTLTLWYTGTPTFGKKGEDGGFVFRIPIQKSTLKAVSRATRVTKTTNTSYIQTTHKPKNNFLLTQGTSANGEVLLGIAISQKGNLKKTSHQLSPKPIGRGDCEGSHCGGSVALDGGAVILIERETSHLTNLLFQPLNEEGMPEGESQKRIVQLNNLDGGIYSADITDALNNSTRFVIYVWSPESMGSKDPNSLYLQVIGEKGDAVGDRILLRTFEEAIEEGQNIAVDPDGRFVLFADGFEGQLMFQALDSSGRPTGESKYLTKTTAGYLNILEAN